MPLGTSTSSRRVWVGVAGSALVVVITAVLLPFRDDVTSATPALVLVVPCVLAALVGGRAVGLAVAVVAAGAFNLVFLEPVGTFKVASVDEAIALVVFGLVALTVATLVAREGERRRAAVQRTIEVEALWKENATMQAEQARLAAEKQALEAIDLQRSALLRSVSHDLRTPLAAIRAVVSDLRDEVLYDAAARQELLELVADEAERLDRLVQNLLSMSRIEAGSMQPERQAVAIDELLDNRVQRLRRLLRDATVTVRRILVCLSSAPTTRWSNRSSPISWRTPVVTHPEAHRSSSQPTLGATSSRYRSPTTARASTVPTSSECSVRSSAAPIAGRVDLASPSAEPSSRPTVARSGVNGVGTDRRHPGARFTFTLPVHHG